jgi:1-acyl-sn-glycerol-3-phosphate acyltransferase
LSGFFYYLIKYSLMVYLGLYNRLSVKGKANVPREGGILIVANHTSYLDPAILGAAFPRRITYMAKEEFFAIPLVKIFFKAYSFPVNRESTRPSSIKEAARRLSTGEAVAIFPGGERDRAGDGTGAAKRGIGLVAKLSGAGVLPVYILGAEKSLPVGSFIPKPAKIEVRIGKLLSCESFLKTGQKDISGLIMEELRGLKA